MERDLEDTERSKLCAEKELEELRKLLRSQEESDGGRGSGTSPSRRRGLQGACGGSGGGGGSNSGFRRFDFESSWEMGADEKGSSRQRERRERRDGRGSRSGSSAFGDICEEDSVGDMLKLIHGMQETIGEDELVTASDDELIYLQNDLEKLSARVRRAKETRLRQRAEELERKRKGDAATAMEASSCCVCVEAPRTVLLLPCRHLCVCESCAARPQLNNKCPVCRSQISDTIKVFCS